MVELDPEPEDDGLGLAAVDAEGPAESGRPAPLLAREPDEMGTDDSPLGLPDRVAGVVPAVGDAVLVGVALQVIDGRRPGPLDLGFLAADGKRQPGESREERTRRFSSVGAPGLARRRPCTSPGPVLI